MDTKTIITPFGKNVVELKEWITGKEYEEIQKPIKDIKVLLEASNSNKGIVKSEINAGEATRKSTEIAIKTIVISIDGSKEGILGKIESMRKEDYLFILKEVDKVVSGENFTIPESKPEDGIGSGN